MYDVRNLKLWAYVRSSSPRPEVLIQQMKGLLTDAEQNGWQIVGTSQDMSTGRTLARMGLWEAQRAIRQQQANADERHVPQCPQPQHRASCQIFWV